MESFQHKERFYIVSKYANCGDLTDHLSNVVNDRFMPEALAQKIFKQVAKALHDMHAKGIYHRDIKMMNIFVR